MHCCHNHEAIVPADPRFESDDFTQAALSERRGRAAHAHFGALVLGVIGALFFGHLIKGFHRSVR